MLRSPADILSRIKGAFMRFAQKNFASYRHGPFVSILFVTVVIVFLALTQTVHATLITIDFENEPTLPLQPNNFAAAGPMQVFTSPGNTQLAAESSSVIQHSCSRFRLTALRPICTVRRTLRIPHSFRL